MKIAIFARPFKDESISYVRNFFDQLKLHRVEVLIHENFDFFLIKKKIQSFAVGYFSAQNPLPWVDYMISVGGDGTFLECITYVKEKQIPILGINAGRLGFLASTPLHSITNDIEALLSGDFSVEERTLIQVNADTDVFEGINFGLNEFCIQKKDTSSMITVHTYVDDVFLNSYWADGLIVATPTGSTAYALSCGGPILTPGSKNFVITPISPHNLNVRPIVVSDSSTISFKIEGRAKNYLVSLDSRAKSVSAQVKLTVKKADFKIKVIKTAHQHFFDTLREKLHWGVDHRN